MSDTVDTFVLDLLEWIGPHPRPYAESLRPGGRRAHACRFGRPRRSVASLTVNLHRMAAPASTFPPPGRSTCASIAELAFERAVDLWSLGDSNP